MVAIKYLGTYRAEGRSARQSIPAETAKLLNSSRTRTPPAQGFRFLGLPHSVRGGTRAQNNHVRRIKNHSGESWITLFTLGKDSNNIVVLGHGVTRRIAFLCALAEGWLQPGSGVASFVLRQRRSGGKFTESNISNDVDVLGCVLDALSGFTVGYVGHSMGGAVGVLRASKDKRVKFLVSLAGMVHTKAFAQREFGSVKPGEGFMWDDPNCPLSQTFMDDLAKINTVVALASQIRVPWLLVHGTEDDVVPIQDSRDIFARANEPKTACRDQRRQPRLRRVYHTDG
jgi:pimeloyl-ACP methyl ester carboxylesterase